MTTTGEEAIQVGRERKKGRERERERRGDIRKKTEKRLVEVVRW